MPASGPGTVNCCAMPWSTPYIEPHNTSVYAQYTVQVDHREAVQEKLREEGIPTAVHYPIPLHLQPVFAGLNLPEGSFPVAESAAKRVLSLPMHPYLTDVDLMRIASGVKEACRRDIPPGTTLRLQT